jgi:hypothetical protein
MDERSPVAVLLGLLLLGGVLVEFFAIGLGIAGICQRDRKKLFGVLGVVIGSLVLFGILLVIIIGALME